jgi:hypothetical protein
MTFEELHLVIQIAMGWENRHLYEFTMEKDFGTECIAVIEEGELEDFVHRRKQKLDATRLTLQNHPIEMNTQIHYVYDFGDHWKHALQVERIAEETTLLPKCLAGKGVCPPEDCGGLHEYAALLDALQDPKHPQHKEYRKWLDLRKGEQFEEAYRFDLKETNRVLEEIFASNK